MSALDEPVAKRIATLIRMILGSGFEGEVMGAVSAVKRVLASEGLSPHDIATVIENANGEIEALKYSDSDARVIYERGIAQGREEEARNRPQDHPPEFYDADGQPHWSAIAMFCQKNHPRLRPNEQEFVDDMAGQMMWRAPSEKQAKWLLSIFIRLGGRRQQ